MSDENKINPNDDAVNAGEAAKKATNTLRANLSMNGEDEHVGSGLMAVHMDRGLQKQLKKDQKEARKSKAFNGMLASVEAQMAEINAQIDFHNRAIAELEKSIESADKAIEQLQNGELPPTNEDGIFKDERLERDFKAWEEKTGKKIDRNDPDAMLVAMLAMRDAQRVAKADHENKRDGLEQDKKDIKVAVESGDPVVVQKVLNEKDIDALSNASEDLSIQKTVDVALDSRIDDGEAAKTNTSIQDKDKLTQMGGFFDLGGDTVAESEEFAASAKAFEVTNGFNNAADGQLIVADIQMQPQQIIETGNTIKTELIS